MQPIQFQRCFQLSPVRGPRWACCLISAIFLQCLYLLKLSEQKLRKIEELGDCWEKRIITKRELRRLRKGMNL
jgi:hypothetical protein